MAFRTRSTRRIIKNTKRKLLFTVVIIIFLLYATIQWILPNMIGGVGVIANTFKSPKKNEKPITENITLAPPVITIPFEATNSSVISISGYSAQGAKVKIYNNDSVMDTLQADSDGHFISKEVHLDPGINNIYGRTVDLKDNESLASKTYKLLYDNEKPKLIVTDPSADAKITESDQGRLYVRGTTEQDAQIFVNNIQQIVDSKGEFHTFVPLSSGDNTVTIKAIDKASNVTQITRTLTYTPPQISSPSPSPSP